MSKLKMGHGTRVKPRKLPSMNTILGTDTIWCKNHQEARPKKGGVYIPFEHDPLRAYWVCAECAEKYNVK